MKLWILLSSTLILFSCSSPRKPLIGPDGTPHRLVTCSSVEVCYREARSVCNGNYKVVNTSTETHGQRGFIHSLTKLLIKCENEQVLETPKTESSPSP